MLNIVLLLNIFKVLSHSQRVSSLTWRVTEHKAKKVETSKINTVYNYANLNFKHRICLEMEI